MDCSCVNNVNRATRAHSVAETKRSAAVSIKRLAHRADEVPNINSATIARVKDV